MDERLIGQIGDLVAARNWPAVAEIGRGGLAAGGTSSERAHYLAANCMAARMLGLTEDARRTYDHSIGSIRAPDHPRLFPILATAAIASDACDDLERLFRMQFPHARFRRISISPLGTFTSWCRENAITTTVIPPESFDVTGSHSWSYTSDPFEIAVIPGAEFISGWDYVIAPTGHVLADSGYMPPEVAFPKFFPQVPVPAVGLIGHASDAETIDLPGRVLFLSVPEQFHVGHWLVDFLPRLRALMHVPAGVKVALPHEAPRKFFEMLSLFGIDGDRLALCELGKRYRAQSLVVARPGNYFRPRPSTIRTLHRVLGPPANPLRKPARRLFFERGAKSRQIMNRADVDAVLEEFGFTTINLAHLSVAEQRTLLEDTEIAVGAFGSDLHSAYFMPENSSVLELIWDAAKDPVTRSNCQIMGIRHEFLICADAGTSQQQGHQKDRDFVVDCADLKTALRGLLKL